MDESKLIEKYIIYNLKQLQHFLPESIVSYLVATILSHQRESMGWKEHLSGIALVFSHLGIQAGLQFFSQRFTMDDLVHSQQPVHCNLNDIRFAERVILRTLPFWRLKQKLNEEVGDLNDGLVKRISDHVHDFASFAQILDVARKPRYPKPLSQITKQLLARADNDARSATQFVSIIGAGLKQVWQDFRALPTPSRKERDAGPSRLLADLRKILTSADTSPKIEQLLTILGDDEAEARFRKNWRNR